MISKVKQICFFSDLCEIIYSFTVRLLGIRLKSFKSESYDLKIKDLNCSSPPELQGTKLQDGVYKLFLKLVSVYICDYAKN